MVTASCPRCQQPIDNQTVNCPYCRTPLKAYGHPGIPLHQAAGEESLCESCLYHKDDSCNFPQRPHAKECTLYQNIAQSELELNKYHNAKSFGGAFSRWVKRHQTWLLLIGLLIVSFLIAL